MHGRLLVELLVFTVLVIVAAVALWRCRPRDATRPARPGPSVPDADEPRVLSVDLSDREL